MDELENLRQEVELLKQRIKYLEDTFATLADMNKSSEMGQYIAQRQRALTASKLVNAAAGSQKLNSAAQQQIIDQLAEEKAAMDSRIEEAIRAAEQNVPAEDDLAEQFTYRDVPGGVEIQGFNGFEIGEELIIPNKIKGKSVVGIGKEAFKNMTFRKVCIPNNVKHIGYDAFSGCRKLKEIHLPDELESIAASCFENTGLTNVVLPPNVKYIDSRGFRDCHSLQKIILNDKLEVIGPSAFWGTDILKIVIPRSVQLVESYAFALMRRGNIEIAILGENTKIDGELSDRVTAQTVFCLAGSEAQKQARLVGIRVKPLSEFRNI